MELNKFFTFPNHLLLLEITGKPFYLILHLEKIKIKTKSHFQPTFFPVIFHSLASTKTHTKWFILATSKSLLLPFFEGPLNFIILSKCYITVIICADQDIQKFPPLLFEPCFPGSPHFHTCSMPLTDCFTWGLIARCYLKTYDACYFIFFDSLNIK